MIPDWSEDFFDGSERFPDQWDSKKTQAMAVKYESMPEEFYTKSGLPIVTPQNFDKFMLAHAASDITWDLQERCSGSGRLSIQAHDAGLCIGFPVTPRSVELILYTTSQNFHWVVFGWGYAALLPR